MTRATLRALLKRRLNMGQTGNNWEDSDLNELLRLGLQEMQKKVLAIDPDAFKYVDRADIVGTTDPLAALYELPAGCMTVYDLRLKSDTSGLYESLGNPIPRHEALGQDLASSTAWYRWDGRHIGLTPPPTTNKAAGLEIEWGPTLTMAVDTDSPTIHDLLHMGVVIWAEKFALGEDGEDSKGVDSDLAPYVNAIPQCYQPSAAGGRFTVGITQEVRP